MWSQEIVDIDNVLYMIKDGEAEVARQDRGLTGDIVIPASIPYFLMYLVVVEV